MNLALPLFAPPAVETEHRADGSLVLRSPLALGDPGRTMNDDLARWAGAAPDRPFLVVRDAGGERRTLTYARARTRVRAVAQGLLDVGASAQRPVAIVAENGIDHALVALGAMEVGIPAAPLAPAYLRPDADRRRFAALLAQIDPGAVLTDDPATVAAALDPRADVAVVDDARALEAAPGAEVERRAAAVDGATVAKILFTSGSTGVPKGVVTTHGMLCANQRSLSLLVPVLDDPAEPPVLVDWLPWSHCFGGSKIFNLVLRRGGTLYVDDGRPTAERFARTLRNLREIAPSAYFGVPQAFAMLAAALEDDARLRERFFSRVRFLQNAGAALPAAVARRLDALARSAAGRRVPVIAGWGATETAPMATLVHECDAPPESIGLPVPGVEIKLAAWDGRIELRVRGPSVTPGYWRDPAAGRAAFDDEGFYCSGDAGELLDPARPAAGIRFAGRLAENFKLASGTWVDAGALRLALLDAAAPLLADAVLTGADTAAVGALLFLDVAAARRVARRPGADLPELRVDPAIRDALRGALRALCAGAAAPSRRIERALVAAAPPSRDDGEVTDKGSLNAAVVRRRRAEETARLHADPPDPEVLQP